VVRAATAMWLVSFDLIILSILRSSIRLNDIASLMSEVGHDASENVTGFYLLRRKSESFLY
jgi:hypothetical protein